MVINKVEFDQVLPTEDQIVALYQSLLQRSHVISHTEIPTYEAHKKFVLENPYRAWFIVNADDQSVGAFYLSNENTVGINIADEFIESVLNRITDYIREHYMPLPEIKSVRASSFTINVAPSNKRLRDALERRGKQVLQTTYLFDSCVTCTENLELSSGV